MGAGERLLWSSLMPPLPLPLPPEEGPLLPQSPPSSLSLR